MNRLRKIGNIRLIDILVAALVVAAAYGILRADVWLFRAGRPIARDLVVSVVADKLAGPDVPLRACDLIIVRDDCDVVYARSAILDPETQWGLVTNMPYLAELASKIVPLFPYEGLVAVPAMPSAIYFYPLSDESSFHIGGRTDCVSQVMLNERYITFGPWNDAREIQSTLTHELIHDQLGNFCVYDEEPGMPNSPAWSERRSVWVEQHTESATVEVLAAQCRYGDKIACGAFWQTIAALSRGSLYTELREARLGFLYEPLMDLLTRDKGERWRAEKSLRHYRGMGPSGVAARDLIIEKYQAGPWLVYVLPGIVRGTPLDTGNEGPAYDSAGNAYTVILGMPFDDTWLMFGWAGRAFLWATT